MSHIQMSKRAVRAGGMLLILATASVLAPMAAAGELPKAEDLINKQIKALGGEKALRKIKNRVVDGKFEIASQGLSGKAHIIGAAPNQFRATIELGEMGTIQRGASGETAWEVSMMMGARLLEGGERDMLLRESDFYSNINWKKHYKSARTDRAEDVAGKPAYVVVVTPNSGKDESWYFDKKTGLLVKTESVIATQMGEIPMINLISDYRVVDGIKLPFKSAQQIMGMEQVLTIEKVEQNAKLAPDAFTLPDDIKALVKDAKSADEKTP